MLKWFVVIIVMGGVWMLSGELLICAQPVTVDQPSFPGAAVPPPLGFLSTNNSISRCAAVTGDWLGLTRNWRPLNTGMTSQPSMHVHNKATPTRNMTSGGSTSRGRGATQ